MKTEQAINKVTTQTTTRDLLRRWAEVEPEWCKNQNRHSFTRDEEDDNFYIKDGDGDTWGWHLVISDSNPSDEEGYYPYKRNALMHIQAAVQEAIVEQGWSFTLTYGVIYGFKWSAEIDVDKSHSICRESENGPGEALLIAYLRALDYKPLEYVG